MWFCGGLIVAVVSVTVVVVAVVSVVVAVVAVVSLVEATLFSDDVVSEEEVLLCAVVSLTVVCKVTVGVSGCLFGSRLFIKKKTPAHMTNENAATAISFAAEEVSRGLASPRNL
ncbi:unknown [Candidatus Apopatosoma intestinale]|nr:unknown [Candidatus Apopatosoma intestinale]